MAEEDKKAASKMAPLELAEQQAAAIPPNLQEAFARVVQAGMKVMFSKETHQMFIEQINQEGDLAQNIGEGMAGLMMLLLKKSNGTMPTAVMVPAGTYLMMQGADFLEKVTGEQITPEILSSAMEAMISVLLKQAGIDKNRFDQGMKQAASGEFTR